jgi:hypothetical protein
VTEGLEKLDVGVDEGGLRAWHERIISTNINIDKDQYCR